MRAALLGLTLAALTPPPTVTAQFVALPTGVDCTAGSEKRGLTCDRGPSCPPIGA